MGLMPRRAKGTQPVVAAPGQQYGMAQETIAAQKAMPLPNAQVPTTAPQLGTGAVPPPPQAPGGAASPPIRGGAGGDPLGAAVQSASVMPPASGTINQYRTQDMPMTDGLPMGPGAMSVTPPGQDSLFMLAARATGDPTFIKLAQRARQP